MYDSTQDTKEHIWNIQGFISQIQSELERRSVTHDASRLEQPEKGIFDGIKSKIEDVEKIFGYGSEEYKQSIRDLMPALRLHYSNNRHHPEYFENGINGMTLIDLIEMFCDWKAASVRSGQPLNIEANKNRFGVSDQLFEILQNTVKELNW